MICTNQLLFYSNHVIGFPVKKIADFTSHERIWIRCTNDYFAYNAYKKNALHGFRQSVSQSVESEVAIQQIYSDQLFHDDYLISPICNWIDKNQFKSDCIDSVLMKLQWKERINSTMQVCNPCEKNARTRHEATRCDNCAIQYGLHTTNIRRVCNLHFQATVFGCSKVVDNAQAHSISWTLNAIITQLQSTNRWFNVQMPCNAMQCIMFCVHFENCKVKLMPRGVNVNITTVNKLHII